MIKSYLLAFVLLLLVPIVGLSQNKKTAKFIQSAQNQYVNGYLHEGLKNLDLAIANEPELASTYHLRASFKLALNDIIGALADYSKAIQLDPKYHDAYKDRGIIRTQVENFDGALADYNKAIELEPKRSDNYNNRGYLYIQLNNLNLAIADIDRAVELDPQNIKAYENLVHAHENSGNVVQAWEAANSFVMTNPNEVSAYLERGRITFLLGSCFSAIQDYDKAIAIAPDDYRAYVERGRLRDDCVEDERGAVLDFNKAIELNREHLYAYYCRTSPNFDLENYEAVIRDCDYYIANDTTFGPIYAQRGVTKSILEDYPAAMKDLRKAIALEPDNSYAYIQLSTSLIFQEKYNEASAILEPYLENFPEDQEVRFQNAKALNNGKEFKKAILEMNQLIKMDSSNFLFFYLRGKAKEGAGDLEGACADMALPARAQVEDSKDFVLSKCGQYMDRNKVLSMEHYYNTAGFVLIGDYANALIELERAISYDSTNLDFYYERGYAKRKLNRADDAVKDFQLVISMDENYADAYGEIGYIELVRGNYELAKKQLKKAIAIDDQSANFVNNYAVCEKRLKNYKAAIPYFKKAIELDPQKMNAYLSLAECYAMEGETVKMCEILEQAEKMGDSYAARLKEESCE